MSSGCVIERELIRESRNPIAACQRASFGFILIAVAWILTTAPDGFSLGAGQGRVMFLQFNLLLFTLIWVLVPLLSFDTVSRERREGTLDLLFLSPLTPLDVLVAKGFVQGLRAALGLLATGPILMIPIVMGGVTVLDVLRMLCLHASATCLALFAGLTASVWHAHPIRAASASMLLSAVFLLGLGLVYVMGSIGVFLHQSAMGWDSDSVGNVAMYFFRSAWDRLPFNQPGFAIGIAPHQHGIAGGGASGTDVLKGLGVFILSILFVWIGLCRLARAMHRQIVRGSIDPEITIRNRTAELGRRFALLSGSHANGPRGLSWRLLLRRYQVLRRSLWVSLGVGVLSVYWWVRFYGAPESLLAKAGILFLVLSIGLSFYQYWVIRREREIGMIALLTTLPSGCASYYSSMVGVALLPVLPSLCWLVAGLTFVSTPKFWLEWMVFGVLYSGLFVPLFAWRRVSILPALAGAVLLGWGTAWGLVWAFESVGIESVLAGFCLSCCWVGFGWIAVRWGAVRMQRESMPACKT